MPNDPRANPLARGPLVTRADLQRAVRDLYEPLRPHSSPGGARVRLGSFGAVYEQAVAELEGFARPLTGSSSACSWRWGSSASVRASTRPRSVRRSTAWSGTGTVTTGTSTASSATSTTRAVRVSYIRPLLRGDLPDGIGVVYTDSMLALADADDPRPVAGVEALSERVASLLAFTGAGGRRRVRLGSERAGVEDGMAWSTWRPWPDVRIDTVCVAVDGAWHLRLHRIRTARRIHTIESGFALAYTPVRLAPDPATARAEIDLAALRTKYGCSALVGLSGERDGAVRPLAVNANLMHPNTAVPVLSRSLEAGDHRLSCAVFASPAEDLPDGRPAVSPAAEAMLERIGEVSLP